MTPWLIVRTNSNIPAWKFQPSRKADYLLCRVQDPIAPKEETAGEMEAGESGCWGCFDASAVAPS